MMRKNLSSLLDEKLQTSYASEVNHLISKFYFKTTLSQYYYSQRQLKEAQNKLLIPLLIQTKYDELTLLFISIQISAFNLNDQDGISEDYFDNSKILEFSHFLANILIKN
ncbi:hypothetical protein BpHYR1_028972 [Brachionus plicatilis]|uniref:Uncharacterized protein n=1 Tax=Brachionus plicatilis TaxID=10195 RepID=A0A3M7RUB0_BRAPC|nr:hypothetical protein BpHYR1_028972 [Brachionus plicatilis]